MAEYHIKIDWSELDQFGHVNNVMVIKYIQAARINFCGLAGINDLYASNKIGFMVAATNCQFKRPLFFPGSVDITTRMEYIKTTSFAINHLVQDQFGNTAAIAEDVLVMYDFNAFSKTNIPEDVKTTLKRL
jgi:acyl-CoA thioester hydrolase